MDKDIVILAKSLDVDILAELLKQSEQRVKVLTEALEEIKYKARTLEEIGVVVHRALKAVQL